MQSGQKTFHSLEEESLLPLIISETQIKTTGEYNISITSSERAIIKNSHSNQCWQGRADIRTLKSC